jgi:PAS domain S-box-containing protein
VHNDSAEERGFQQRDRGEAKHLTKHEKLDGPPEQIIEGLPQTEQRLQQKYHFISAILDTTDMLVIVLDRQGHIVHFNSACERLSGYSFEEVKRKRVWDFLLIPGDIEAVQSTFKKLQAVGISNEWENYWVTKERLQQTSPELFEQLVEKYQKLLDLALEEKIFKVEYNISDALNRRKRTRFWPHRLSLKRLRPLLAGSSVIYLIKSVFCWRLTSTQKPSPKWKDVRNDRTRCYSKIGNRYSRISFNLQWRFAQTTGNFDLRDSR